eukprot:7402108-Ditylum_brightwellii.AAC.1
MSDRACSSASLSVNLVLLAGAYVPGAIPMIPPQLSLSWTQRHKPTWRDWVDLQCLEEIAHSAGLQQRMLDG